MQAKLWTIIIKNLTQIHMMDIINLLQITPNTNTLKYNAIKHYIYNPKHNGHEVSV